jgi:hypothetical protein
LLRQAKIRKHGKFLKKLSVLWRKEIPKIQLEKQKSYRVIWVAEHEPRGLRVLPGGLDQFFLEFSQLLVFGTWGCGFDHFGNFFLQRYKVLKELNHFPNK